MSLVSALCAVRIVLVETTHPGNIGAAARAMKNMGLSDLCLLRPRHFPDGIARARASGAQDVLAGARVCDDLDDAIGDCGLVIGASARLRSLAWPMTTPREAAKTIVGHIPHTPVAVMFGREKSGLTNEEIQRCRLLMHIPANPDYTSLNLAMAVQVLAYELWLAAGSSGPPEPDPEFPLASNAEVERFYEHLQQVLLETGFLDPDNPRQLISRLRRLFGRIDLDQNEINILRGILASVQQPKQR